MINSTITSVTIIVSGGGGSGRKVCSADVRRALDMDCRSSVILDDSFLFDGCALLSGC